jgi:alpha-glucosidase
VLTVNQSTSSIAFTLQYTGNDSYYIKSTSPIVKDLIFTINCYSSTDLSFKITNINKTRFEVPQYGIFPTDPYANFSFPLNSSLIQFSYIAEPFDFKLIRRTNNETLFDTTGGNIIFSEHYL